MGFLESKVHKVLSEGRITYRGSAEVFALSLEYILGTIEMLSKVFSGNERRKPGRKADFLGEETKRITVTITLDAWKALRTYLANSQEGETQNAAIDKAVIQYVGSQYLQEQDA